MHTVQMSSSFWAHLGYFCVCRVLLGLLWLYLGHPSGCKHICTSEEMTLLLNASCYHSHQELKVVMHKEMKQCALSGCYTLSSWCQSSSRLESCPLLPLFPPWTSVFAFLDRIFSWHVMKFHEARPVWRLSQFEHCMDQVSFPSAWD